MTQLNNTFILNEELLLGHLPGFILIKDLQSIYLAGCHKIKKEFGLRSKDEIGRYCDYSIPHDVYSKYAEMYVSQDAKLIKNQTPISGFYAVKTKDDYRAFSYNKSLIIDSMGNANAIFAYNVEVYDPHIAKAIVTLHREDKDKIGSVHHYTRDNQFGALSLSLRQSQCLFYILRGKSSPEIARRLGLSKRTIENYVNHLKNKLFCTNKSELIEKSISLGYLEVIPEGVI